MDTPDPVTKETLAAPTVAPNEEVIEIRDESEDCFECRACGYTYNPIKGDDSGGIEPNTAFDSLPITWRCPVCSARPKAFANIGPVGAASGFKENLGFGFGVNTLTPSQKNVLIFGSLLVGLAIMLSFYGLG
ncbi:MAG: rubredoxin [Geitlerinemataceae cyanobacterium]